MIRPFTVICLLAAAGSGLYLYSTKHRTLMLDARIADVLRQADEARARTTALDAAYAALNEPGRLGELSQRFLKLRPFGPTQYVQLANLDRHLPPIEHFPPPGQQPPDAPAAGATDQDADASADAAPPADAIAAIEQRTVVARATPTRLPAGDRPRPAAYAKAVPAARQTRGVQDEARIADAGATAEAGASSLGRPRRAALAGDATARAQPMPMAAPRPVQSSLLATAAYGPAGTPAFMHPRNRDAAYATAGYGQPRARIASYSSPGQASGVQQVGSMTGSMLGSAGGSALAPPVPVAN